MGRHPLAVYRWLRFTITEIMEFVTTATQKTALDILNTRQFIEMDLVRRLFVIPFVRDLNFDFYARLATYHDNVGHITRTLLVSILVTSILVSVCLNVVGFGHMRRQVAIGLSSLMLVPEQSMSRNPYITVIINKLN